MKSQTCPKCLKPAGLMIRVNPKGEVGEFWCADCVKKNEPELYANEMEDGVVADIFEAVTGKTIK